MIRRPPRSTRTDTLSPYPTLFRAPIDADADERAVYLAGGDAALDNMALRPMTLYVLRPGLRATLRSVDGARVMLCGGEAFATPRHVWWNRSEERRVGKECVSTCRSRWSPYH